MGAVGARHSTACGKFLLDVRWVTYRLFESAPEADQTGVGRTPDLSHHCQPFLIRSFGCVALDRSLGIGRKIETICFRPLPHRREQSQIAGTENDFGRLAVILQSAQNVAE
jgi:hypothetical protein